jgi:hypothetical protein
VVANRLVSHQQRGVVAGARGDDRAGEQLGITQRVGQAVRTDRILEVARIADQGPARFCGSA